MTTKHFRVAAIIAVLLQVSAAGLASAASPGKSVEIGTKFPDRFPVIQNFYLGKPVIGFGSDVGRVDHVPVIFLHGNNDTPFATACNPFGRIQALRNSSSITATTRASSGDWVTRAISAT